MLEEKIISLLTATPDILRELILAVPDGRRKERRIAGKWSAHEHACHIVHVQPLMTERIRRFMREERPDFTPYLPGKSSPADELPGMDLEDMLARFPAQRKEFCEMLRNLPPELWQKEADHGEYDRYTPYILARHLVMHDHTHMYRIEELWLAKEL